MMERKECIWKGQWLFKTPLQHLPKGAEEINGNLETVIKLSFENEILLTVLTTTSEGSISVTG
jgi:hypothetical protein